MPIVVQPEGLAFDRIPTPAGEAMVMWDGELRLRVFDWTGYEPRMRRLLERYYGPVEPKAAVAPPAMKAALSAYFDGDLTSLDAIECATGGTPFQRAVWAALRGIPPGTTLLRGQVTKGGPNNLMSGTVLSTTYDQTDPADPLQTVAGEADTVDDRTVSFEPEYARLRVPCLRPRGHGPNLYKSETPS